MKKIIVSKFKNYESTSPIDIDLFEWLNDTTHKETVLKIRNLTDKTEIKKLKSKKSWAIKADSSRLLSAK